MVVDIDIPEWLIRFLQIDFNNRHAFCEAHGKYNAFFCVNCMGKPWCDQCSKLSLFAKHVHKGHRILQVHRVSRKASIRTEDATELMDIEDIQEFRSGNNYNVVYIYSRGFEQQRGGGRCCCRVCGYRVQSFYDFCSIACSKIRRNTNLIKNYFSQDKSYEKTGQTTTPSDFSPRKKRRKGIPRRSPFY